MINYRKIWESINSESKSGTTQTQIARRIPSNGVFQVFLATDFKKSIRLLYVKIDNNQSAIIEKFPRFNGLEISIVQTSLGEYINHPFIKFKQSIPNIDNIFELVISDLCDKVIAINSKSDLDKVLDKSLQEWRFFFESRENEILSLEAQKGLIGELIFLKDFLFKKYPFAEALDYWTGSDKTNHDFQIANKAVEVKTTASAQHKKFIVSSEKQLDSTGLDKLYLAVVTLNLHDNMYGRTLPGLVKEIYILLKEDPVTLFYAELKLIKSGYNMTFADRYKIGFSLNEIRFFEVSEDFPRLLHTNLPPGVGDLKYSVVVSACASFEVKSDILKNI